MKQQLITTLLALCITFPLNIFPQSNLPSKKERIYSCLLYTSDAADD